MSLRFPYRSERQCPHCGGYDVVRSRRGSLLQPFLFFLLLRPYRCLECYKRFYGYVRAARVEAEEQERRAA